MRPVEREAIAAFLNAFDFDVVPTKTLVIERTTADVDRALLENVGSERERLRKAMPQATEKVIDDFLRVLAQPSQLQIPSHLVRRNIRLQMVRSEDINRIFDATNNFGEAWQRFYKAYPDAACLVRFSRAGIDESAGQALFFISTSKGSLRAVGEFVLLHRPLGIWRIQASEMAWIS